MRFSLLIISAVALVGFGTVTESQARGVAMARGGGYAGARGAAVGGARYGAAAGPYGGYRAGARRGGTYVGPRGTTVQAGSRGRVSVGPYGGVHAAGASGVRVTTPSGKTYARGSRGGATAGPYGGVHAHGAYGTRAGGYAAGRRGGVAVGPYGGVAVRGGGVAVGSVTRYYSPAVLRTQAVAVRGGYSYGVFTPAWYRVHTVVWRPTRWVVPNIWVVPAWPAVSVFCGISGPPIVYDYGSNVVIENNYVYVNGDQMASVDRYAEQAEKLANRGRKAKPASDTEWQPLGVFGMIQADEKVAQNIFQLAVNKAGVIRGNYYNAVADQNSKVYGHVNRKTQRVAWSIGKKKTIVYETGLENLTKDQTTVLVHYGKERTQQMILVRLEEPKDSKKDEVPRQ